MLTAERLRSVLSYDSQSGVFKWKEKRGPRSAMSPAGCIHKVDGRIYIGVDGQIYKAHRLAWLYVHGEWPKDCIDHIDGNCKNNSIANLRPATQAQNSQNIRGAHKDSRTGMLGVQRSGQSGWYARLKCKDVTVKSKKFKTAAEAHTAYMEIKACFHPFSIITKGIAV